MKTLHSTLTVLCCFATALLIGWKLLHAVNFGYGFWYSQLEIGKHIAEFAPQNRLGKTGFEKTSYPQRTELFREIGDAINNGGEGLRTLAYKPHPEAQPLLLLTDAEATHLEDVANLIDLLMPLGWIAAGLLVVLIILALALRIPLPRINTSLLTLLVIALLLTLVIVAVGPHEVFKALHEFVFPKDHQWFFYYQESLMTTLMKAPDIFFAISATWAAIAAAIYLLISVIFSLTNKKQTVT